MAGLTPEEVLALARKYTDKSIEGAGVLKGKNCTIQSIIEITGGSRITFAWYDNDEVIQTDTLDVMNGAQGPKGDTGVSVESVDLDNDNHLIVTMSDETEHDAGAIKTLVQLTLAEYNALTQEQKNDVNKYYWITDANAI